VGDNEGITAKKAKFDLLSVSVAASDGERIVYQDGVPVDLFIPDIEPPVEESVDCREIAISLITPLRIKEQKHLVNTPPPFSLLVKALISRVCRLEAAYCVTSDKRQSCDSVTEAFACPFDKYISDCPKTTCCRDLLTQAEHVEIADKDILWADPGRYSSRQDTHMKTGGLVGGVTYRGNLTPFIPLLRLGERINIGKLTTMGLGKYRMEY
jgi:hypothetical protein